MLILVLTVIMLAAAYCNFAAIPFIVTPTGQIPICLLCLRLYGMERTSTYRILVQLTSPDWWYAVRCSLFCCNTLTVWYDVAHTIRVIAVIYTFSINASIHRIRLCFYVRSSVNIQKTRKKRNDYQKVQLKSENVSDTA
jgi:hypothetical protein